MEIEKTHDKIATLCLTHFKKLPKNGKPNSNEWTILSCIVLEFHEELTVVALGTGTKCIGKSKVSHHGDIINDSHAEVICRRSFLRYLYSQMKIDSHILTFNNEIKKFCLNKDVKFHFFTTHVPCGDAAIFPKQNPDLFGNVISREDEDISPLKKMKTDIFRTGAKCLTDSPYQDPKLPGINYHTLGVVRTKPGRGDPTLSVSCSDKLAKWCCLGLQGALLSLLLEKPIYLTSFTIVGNTSFCRLSFNRALYTRLENVKLTLPYHQKYLLIGQSTSDFEFSRNESKQPCPASISWCDIKDNGFEVLVQGKRQGITKKNKNSAIARSKISKYELFKIFKDICNLKDITFNKNYSKNANYKNTKMLANNYQDSWVYLKTCFKLWPEKNVNLLSFILENVQS